MGDGFYNKGSSLKKREVVGIFWEHLLHKERLFFFSKSCDIFFYLKKKHICANGGYQTFKGVLLAKELAGPSFSFKRRFKTLYRSFILDSQEHLQIYFLWDWEFWKIIELWGFKRPWNRFIQRYPPPKDSVKALWQTAVVTIGMYE